MQFGSLKTPRCSRTMSFFELNQSDKYGSAIIGFGNAAITFNNTIVQSNTVLLSNWRFGAINSSGTLTITNSLLRGNRSDAQGGPITAIGKVLNQKHYPFR